MVGIKVVARHAGVSVGTVSNVINRPGSVSEATRIRVQASIAELGYVRSEVRQPAATMGSLAAELLLEETDGTSAHEHRQVVLQPELVVRGSSLLGRARQPRG